MAEIVVCGGSVIGLSTAMLLAREGHHVTVLEADPSSPPDDAGLAWDAWGRRGVPQFHQPHNLFSRARQIMDDDLPGLTDRLVTAGGWWMDPLGNMPPAITERDPLPDDDRFLFVNARRPVIEAAVAAAASDQEGVEVRRGVGVRGLRAEVGPGGRPHVTGVVLDGGDEHSADLVVDATGRRTKLPEWLAALGGGPPHLESDDSGFVYYTRYFLGPDRPVPFGPAIVHLGSISVLTIASDNNTWSVTVFGASADKALHPLRDPDTFERVVARCPLQAHWLRGRRISDIETMAGVLDKYRRYVVDGEPVATGVVPVGDAWACTNPSAGRGISIGMIHAQRLRDVVREGIDDADALVRRFDEVTERDVTPFYRNQIAADRRRIAEMDAARGVGEPPAPDRNGAAVGVALMHEAVVFRGIIETVTCLALPQEVFARPEFQEKVSKYLGQEPEPFPGPTREELLAAVAG